MIGDNPEEIGTLFVEDTPTDPDESTYLEFKTFGFHCHCPL